MILPAPYQHYTVQVLQKPGGVVAICSDVSDVHTGEPMEVEGRTFGEAIHNLVLVLEAFESREREQQADA